MFSPRALVSTTLLALVVSGSANPIQLLFEEYYSTIWMNDYTYTTETSGCEGLEATSFGQDYSPTLERIEGGTDACAYRFANRWPSAGGDSVGKTLQSGGHFEDGPGSEIATLREIGELHAHETDNKGRDWVVMKSQPGKWLTQTQAYREVDGKLDEARTSCRNFYESVYTAVYLDAKKYITDFGCIHRGKAKMGESNVLIEFDANKPTAHLIDWAYADCSPSNKNPEIAVAYARLLCKDYAISSASPVDDCGGYFTRHHAHEFCSGLSL